MEMATKEKETVMVKEKGNTKFLTVYTSKYLKDTRNGIFFCFLVMIAAILCLSLKL
jgi:hypothetical protein